MDYRWTTLYLFPVSVFLLGLICLFFLLPSKSVYSKMYKQFFRVTYVELGMKYLE